MRQINYSATKADLFYPARAGNEFLPNGRPPSEAALCAELCRLVYCRLEPAFQLDRPTISAVLDRIGFSGEFFDSSSGADGRGTHALLAFSTDPDPAKRLTVVAFRGTDADDPTDLVDDGDFRQIKWHVGGCVHHGFAAALDGVLEPLMAALGDVQGRLLFTGHSLGAAMATLLASIRKPDALYTFGSPLVGDAKFVETLAGVDSRRFVDCCDVVTRIPPPELGLEPYAHYGDPYYIDQDGAITLAPGDDAIHSDRLSAAASYLLEKTWRTGNVGVRELADHAPINYVYAVSADASQP